MFDRVVLGVQGLVMATLVQTWLSMLERWVVTLVVSFLCVWRMVLGLGMLLWAMTLVVTLLLDGRCRISVMKVGLRFVLVSRFFSVRSSVGLDLLFRVRVVSDLTVRLRFVR